ERLKVERIEAERLEKQRLAAERLKVERIEAERLEEQRLAAERLKVERIEAEQRRQQQQLAAQLAVAAGGAAATTTVAEMALKTALKKTKRKKKKATGGATQTLWAPPAYPLDWAPATPSSVPAESTSSSLPLPVACQVMPPLSPGWVMAAKPKGRRSIKSRGEAEGGSPPTASSRTLHAPPSLEALLQCAASGEHDGPVQGREQSIRSAEEEEGDAAARARERRTADAALQRAIAVGMLAGVRFALSRATATGVDDVRLEAARTFLATAAAAAVKVAAAQPDAPDATTGAEPGSEIVEATAAPEPPPIENWLHHLDALGAAEDDEADTPRAVAMQHARLPKWGIARMSSFGGSLSSHSVLSPMSLVAQARARVARARQAKGSSPFSPQSADMLSPDMLENKPPLDSPRAPELSI
ncbi:hypothetical protein Ctob_012482, partial [Chrysochromulina tobinii]